MNPKISVIIPCYNHGQFIRETVESVYAQTFRDFELIIVDDGSNDEGTVAVLDELQIDYPEMRIINQKNGHLSNARNNGIRLSRGEFFLPLDSDDIIEPTMLEKCYAEISKKTSLGFVYTYVRFFGDINFVWKNQEYNFYDLLFFNHPTVCGLVRKKAWEEVGGYDENMKSGYEDWEFWINIGEKGWFGEVLKKPLFRYRKHGKSMINNAREKHAQIISYIKGKHAGLYSEESLNKIKSEWKSGNIFVKVCKRMIREISTIKLKFALAGVLEKREWREHPVRSLGRCVPIRIKIVINNIFRKKIFDTSYFGKNL